LQYAGEDQHLAEQISPESRDIYAQILYGIREEGARTISRCSSSENHTGITAFRGEPQVPQIAAIMARELGWNRAEQDLRVEQFRKTS